jgi:beta-lactam-binding protein with PASTA domain
MARRLLVVLVPAVLIFAPVAEAQVTVKVPDVVGKKMGAARRIIQQADLEGSVE